MESKEFGPQEVVGNDESEIMDRVNDIIEGIAGSIIKVKEE